MKTAGEAFARAGAEIRGRGEALLNSGGDASAYATLNHRLMMAERDLISPAGLPDRPWYRHVIYAPGCTPATVSRRSPDTRGRGFGELSPRRRASRHRDRRAAARDENLAGFLRWPSIDKPRASRFSGCVSGSFFLFEGIGKIRWFGNSSLLAGQLAGWLQTSGAAALNRDYLERFAIPYVAILARLVPLGEIASGLALIVGFWTPVFAFVAFVMAVNFNFASGAMLKYSFLTNGYGLPVLGLTLALTFGGARLPLSFRGAAPPRASKTPRS